MNDFSHLASKGDPNANAAPEENGYDDDVDRKRMLPPR